jgi:hypothetical protein
MIRQTWEKGMTERDDSFAFSASSAGCRMNEGSRILSASGVAESIETFAIEADLNRNLSYDPYSLLKNSRTPQFNSRTTLFDNHGSNI